MVPRELWEIEAELRRKRSCASEDAIKKAAIAQRRVEVEDWVGRLFALPPRPIDYRLWLRLLRAA